MTFLAFAYLEAKNHLKSFVYRKEPDFTGKIERKSTVKEQLPTFGLLSYNNSDKKNEEGVIAKNYSS